MEKFSDRCSIPMGPVVLVMYFQCSFCYRDVFTSIGSQSGRWLQCDGVSQGFSAKEMMTTTWNSCHSGAKEHSPQLRTATRWRRPNERRNENIPPTTHLLNVSHTFTHLTPSSSSSSVQLTWIGCGEYETIRLLTPPESISASRQWDRPRYEGKEQKRILFPGKSQMRHYSANRRTSSLLD